MEEELFLEYPEYIEANNVGQVGTWEYGREGRDTTDAVRPTI